MLRTRSPLGLPLYCYAVDLVRLACVKHAASVRPEPGSNSPTKTCSGLAPEGESLNRCVSRAECLTGEYPWLVALRSGNLDLPQVWSLWTCELTDSVQFRPEGLIRRCPHWRSVFSSVFKEPRPELRARSATHHNVLRGEPLATLLLVSVFRGLYGPSGARYKASAGIEEHQPLWETFPTTNSRLPFRRSRKPPVSRSDAASRPSASRTRFPARTAP